MDLTQFLVPLDDPAPGGADLYESGEIMALDMLAKWGSPEEEVSWRELQENCLSALEKSRDLRPASYLAAALLHTEGLRGFCDGMALLRGLLEQFWDSVHPPLDEDGDAMERANAVFNLTNFHSVLKPLRTAYLVEDRAAGRFSLQDVEIAEGKIEPPEGFVGDLPQPGLIQGAFQSMDPEALAALHALVVQAVADTAGIETAFREQVGAEQAPDLARLQDGFKRISLVLGKYLQADGATDAAESEFMDTTPGADGAVASQRASVPGEIRSRQDAKAAMDRISAFFSANEPSSPVPLLMNRAKRLVDMNILDILQDIAPDAVDEVRKLGGVTNDD